jgi:SAM-dependent methyltransferase
MPKSEVATCARIKVVTPQRLSAEEFALGAGELGYSVRRYYIDEFFTRHARGLAPGSRVLDIGGFKGKRRGRFGIGDFAVDVTVANIATSARPDILCDACEVPRPDGGFDVVILAEVLEHLPDAGAALGEAGRLLRPGGVLLATVPFMFRVHADPIDVARYAPDWWMANLVAAGFDEGTIERQGSLFSVMSELARAWAYRVEETGSFWPGGRETALGMLAKGREWALRHERGSAGEDPFYSSFTTGYGVCAIRSGGEAGGQGP